MFTTECLANEVKNYKELEDDLQLYEKYKDRYIECAFAPGPKVIVYPNRFQMRERVYVEGEKCYKRLMVDVDISKIPEKYRNSIQNCQNKLKQAIKALDQHKIDYISEYL